MADIVNIGATANDGSGDDLRTSFQLINQRLQELLGTLSQITWAPGLAISATPLRQWTVVAGQAYVAASNHTAGATFAADLAAGRWLAVDVAQVMADLASSGAGKGASLVVLSDGRTVQAAVDEIEDAASDLVLSLAGTGGAEQVGLADGRTLQEFVDAESGDPALALIKDRTIPSAFSWAGIYPTKCLAVGQAQASETVGEYARRVHSALIGAGVVYVDPVNGLDGNSGSVSAPVKTLSQAVRVLAPSLVLCMPGEYAPFDFRNTDAQGNKLKIIKALGPCVIKEAADDPATATWTADGTYPNTYWMPLTPANKPVLSVLDTSRVCEEGQPMPLAKEASILAVNSMANGIGYFHDAAANRLYVRYLGSANLNTVKARLKIITGDAASRVLVYGSKLLMEGQWHADGVTLMPLQNAGVRPILYMDVQADSRPTVRHAISHGLDSLGADTYISGAWLHRNKGDNFHYTDSAGLDCRAVEIDCKATFAGDKAGEPAAANTSNGSSMHLAGDVLRVNGVYRRNWGPDVVDTGTGESWNVGTVSGPGAPSGNDYGMYTTGPVLRMDCCSSFGHAQADIAVTAGGDIKLFASSFRTQSNAGGTIETYSPA